MVRFWFGVLVRSNSSDSGSVRPNQKKGSSVGHYSDAALFQPIFYVINGSEKKIIGGSFSKLKKV